MTKRREEVKHGDLAMYSYHKCRCDLCRKARSEYNADLRQRNREKQAAQPPAPVVLRPKAKRSAGVVAVCTIPTAHLRNW